MQLMIDKQFLEVIESDINSEMNSFSVKKNHNITEIKSNANAVRSLSGLHRSGYDD